MKKILIVDDEQDIVESLKFVLEAADFTCYCMIIILFVDDYDYIFDCLFFLL